MRPALVRRAEVPGRYGVPFHQRLGLGRQPPGSIGIGLITRRQGRLCEAMDQPGLAARPAGLVGIALMGLAAQRPAAGDVEDEGVKGGVVGPDDMVERGLRMGIGRLAEIRPAGLAIGPIEQSEILHGVGDDPAIGELGLHALGMDVFGVPGLDIAPVGPVAANQLPRRGERHLMRLPVSRHQPFGDAAQRELEAEIVVLRVLIVEDAAEYRPPRPRPVEEGRIPGQLQRQPELPGLEADHPVVGAAIDPAVVGQADLGIAQADHGHGLAQFGDAALQRLLVRPRIAPGGGGGLDGREIGAWLDAHRSPPMDENFSHHRINFVNNENFS